MPTIVYIAKEATPEQLGWRARIAAAEKPLIGSVLAWVASLHAAIDEAEITRAVITRSHTALDHVLQAITFSPDLATPTVAEAEREFARIAGGHGMRLSFDLRDPNFTTAVQEHEARLVREVTTETRRAIAAMIDRGYRNGTHTLDVAREIREAVGLTSRQAQAVLNYADAQRKLGVRPDVVADRAMRYAARMRTRRAQTIARTETARAQVQGRLQSYQQAADKGLFDVATAELVWSSVQTDPTEICAILDGERVPFGETFNGLLPPAHPACRCSVHLDLSR